MATMARSSETEKVWHEYHAEANVLSGHLKQPVNREIYRQAAVGLDDLRGGHFFQIRLLPRFGQSEPKESRLGNAGDLCSGGTECSRRGHSGSHGGADFYRTSARQWPHATGDVPGNAFRKFWSRGV